MNIAIVGATGNVGRKVLEVLELKKFPIGQLYLVASPKSVGKKISFNGKDCEILNLETFDFTNVEITFFAAGGKISEQYAAKAAKSGRLISIDLKEMEPIGNTVQIQGDFTEDNIQTEIKKHIKDKIDVVMSDMAVNTTGIKNIDSIQTGELCKEAMIFSKEVMAENGVFISKIFMGGSFNEIVALGKKIFKEVKVFKPKSSRKDSKESFIICKKLR